MELDRRLVVLALIVLASWPSASAAPVERTDACVPVRTGDPLPALSQAVDLRDHPPIVVTGGAIVPIGLVTGVCGGRGTAQDPYRIENWYIDAGNWTVNGQRVLDAAIFISGTTDHILVRNVTIVNLPRVGILVRDAENVRIENVRILDNTWRQVVPTVGVSVESSRNVRVTDTYFANQFSDQREWVGIHVEGSVDVLLQRNRFEQIGDSAASFVAVHVGNSTGLRAVANEVLGRASFTGRFYGFHVTDAISPKFERNVVLGPSVTRGVCFAAFRATAAEATDNSLRRCATLFALDRATGGTLARNVLDGGTRGLLLQASTGATLAGNRIANATRPFNVTGANVADYHHDVGRDNLVGGAGVLYLRGTSGGTVDATGAAIVYAVGVRDLVLHRASPQGQTVGLTVVDALRSTFRDLDLRNNDVGLRVLASRDVRFDRVQSTAVQVERSDDVVLANLTVRGAYTGIHLGDTDTSRIEHALVEGNVLGIRIAKGNTNTIVKSIVRSNALGGVHLLQPDFARVTESDVSGNSVYGVRHDGISSGGSRSDLRGTWWSSANGPTVTGSAGGDRFVHGNNAVFAYSPWRTSPTPGAGPATP